MRGGTIQDGPRTLSIYVIDTHTARYSVLTRSAQSAVLRTRRPQSDVLDYFMIYTGTLMPDRCTLIVYRGIFI